MSNLGLWQRLRHEVSSRRFAGRSTRAMLPPPPSAFRRYGKGSWLVPPVRVWRPELIEIGDDVLIHEFSVLSVQPHPSVADPKLVIGDRCLIAGMVTFSSSGDTTIGADTMIGAHSFIGDASHRFEDPNELPSRSEMTPPRPVRVGNGVFIGINSLVMPGVTIGDGAMIGAGAVVTTDLPARCVAVGNPAQVVRQMGEDGVWRRVGSRTDDTNLV